MAPTPTLLPTSAPAPAGPAALRVERVVAAGGYTAFHAGDHVVVLPCRPSSHAARSVTRSLRHVAGLVISIADGEVSAVVLGVRHRTPVERSCALSAAVALARAGVPTQLVTDHSIGEGSVDAAPAEGANRRTRRVGDPR